MKSTVTQFFGRHPDLPAHFGSVLWTVLLVALLWISMKDDHRERVEFARAEACASSRADIAYSRWFNELGGIYTRVTSDTPPDSHLGHLPDRDAKTDDGQPLTLVNPGRVIQLVHRRSQSESNTHAHLIHTDGPNSTSPGDPWNEAALRELAAGKPEVTGLVNESGTEYFRLMAPLSMESRCVECHAQSTDHDPGVGWTLRVDVPMNSSRFATSQVQHRHHALGLSMFWLVGLGGIQGASTLTRKARRDREKAFQELQEREARYRNVIESSPDGFCLIDEQGLILEVNHVYVRQSGYRREELLGRPITNLEGLETSQETAARMEKIRRDGGAVFDTAHRTKDGSLWPVEAKVTYSPDFGGRYAAFFRDLSGPKRSEILTHIRGQLADRLPTDSLTQLLEAAIGHAKVWTGSTVGYFHFIDSDEEHLTLQTGSPNDGRTALLIEAPNHSAKIADIEIWAESLRRKQSVIFNCPSNSSRRRSRSPGVSNSDRELVVPIRLGTQTVALFGVGGKNRDYGQADTEWMTALGALALDLAQRKRAQEELTQFFHLVPDLVCIITSTGHMHRLNPEWERVLGVPIAEIQSGRFLDRVHPDDRRATLRRFLQVIRGGNVQRFVNRCLAADGSYRWIEWNAASMPHEQLICAAASDVTERRRSEHLARLQGDLGLALSSNRDRDPHALLQFCLDAAVQASGTECGGLYLKDPATGALEMVAHHGLSEAFVAQVRHCPAESPKTLLVNQGAILYTCYPELTSELSATELGEGLLAIGIASVRHDDEVVGCINVASRKIEKIPVWARKNLEALIPQIGNVIVRIRTEQALRQSEERFRLLFDHATDAIFWADAGSGLVLNCNRAAEGLLGRPRADIIGQSNTSIHPPGEAERYRDMFRSHALECGAPDVEAEVLRGDGSRRTVIISPAVIDIDGQSIVQGIFHDITDRKRVESDLLRHQALLEAIYDNAPIMICLLDENGGIERMNRAMSRLVDSSEGVDTSHSPCNALGCIHALASGRDCGAGPNHHTCTLRLALEETRRTGIGQQQVEFTLKSMRQGRPQELRLSVSTAMVPVEGQAKILICLEDITAARQLETQFRQAQKMEAVGQLAGGVAHDFNNILGAMMMNLHLAQEGASLDAETKATLRELEEEARRGAELTRRLLLLGRREVVQIRRINLNEVVEGLLKMLHRLLGEHIELSFQPSSLPSWIDADPGMMEQVLMNLSVNARDAMPKGGPLRLATLPVEITPDLARHTADARVGSFICLSVSDAGTGIPPEIVERIFEPFFTTKSPGNGTGLGLATVYGIVRQHQGWIGVESAPNAGTTFRVYLPAAPPAESASPRSSFDDLPRGTETLLLVEDDPSLLRTASLLLRSCGYRVLQARNGPEALRIWQDSRGQIQLLFTDIVMPGGVSGLELAQMLRRSKPGLKVLMTTGYSAELVNSGGLPDNGITLLPKPYAPAELAQSLRTCLDRT